MAQSRIVRQFRSNGEKVVIRYPRISDSDDLLENINSLVAERAFITLQKKQTKRKEEKWFKTLLKKIKRGQAVALVVEINGKVLGLSQVEKSQREEDAHLASFGIAIGKRARGRHIGERLTKTVIAEAKRVLKIRIIVLTAFVCNRPAVNCYRKCGFVKFGLLKGGIGHYGQFLDRIYMAKYLYKNP